MSWTDLEPYIGAVLYLSAGGMLALFVYGRGLLGIKDGMLKAVVTRGVLVLLTVPWAIMGYWRGLDWMLVLPGAIWIAGAFVEVDRIVAKRRHCGEQPVEEQVTPFSLFRPFTTTDLAVRRYEQQIPEWKCGRLRIAHISDMHVHNTLDAEYFRSVNEKLLSWDPDVVFITGDFVSRIKYAGLIPGVLEGLNAPKGVYASLGNHDYWTDAGTVKAELAKTNVQLLDDDGAVIEVGGGEQLLLSACNDPWGPAPWKKPASATGVPMAVLSHTADNIYKLSEAGAGAVFSGHYHAGQAALPWYGSVIIPSKYGRRFDHGHFLVNDTHLYVTAGVGAAFPPFRLYCHPEILIVDMLPGG